MKARVPWMTTAVAMAFAVAACRQVEPAPSAQSEPTSVAKAETPAVVQPEHPAVASTTAQSAAPPASTGVPCVISASGIASLQVGLSLGQAKARMPEASFTRASDGEGVALVDVAVDGESLVLAYTGEEDAARPVDMTRAIEHLETFSPACATAGGIHPGSPVEAAEAAYGAIRAITRSEIESREYVEFAHAPAGLQFRLDYTGDFADGESETTRHAPGARIFSIAVSKP